MDIHFRVLRNTHDEISMGHKHWFEPAKGCDAISVTANAPGFTPLVAVGRHFGWNYGMLEVAAGACNKQGEVAVVSAVTPKLFLVPATKGHGDAKFLITDLLKAASAVGVRGLHFTHFGFLQGRFPAEELTDILTEILSPHLSHTLQTLVFDIDVRAESRLYGLMCPKG